VVVTDSLPASLVFVSGTGGTCSQGAGGAVSCALGSIPSGGSALLTIAARANALGLATNLVRVTSPQLDLAPANNTRSNVLQILPAADMSLRVLNKRAQAVLNQAFLTE